MPRSASSTAPQGSQAEYILSRLVNAGRVTAAEIQHYVSEMVSEISALEQRLTFLRSASDFEGPAPAPSPARPRRAASAPAEEKAPTGGKRRRKQNLTPQRRAELRKQGRYLALMRQVPKTRRPQFKSMFRSKGIDAALRAMEKAVK